MRKRFSLAVTLVMVLLMAGAVPMCANAACVNPPSGMVTWWGGDNNALDIVGTNNGTIHGGVTYGQGEVGRSFDFNGAAGTYLQVPSSAALNIQGSLSISAWVYIRNTSGTRLIAGKAGGTQLYSVDGILHFVIYSGGDPKHVASTPALAGNSWHHVAGVFDGNAGVSRIYIDGVLNNTSAPIPGQPDSNTAPYEIGGFSAYGANLDGLIDEIAIFNQALTGTDVQNIYTAGSVGMCRSSAPLPSGLISWWKAENNANDQLGVNNGSLINGATFAAGKVGQAFSLDGSDDYVQVPDSPSLNIGAGDFSLNLWVNYAVVKTGVYALLTNVFIAQDEGGGPTHKWIFFSTDDGLYFHINNAGSSTFVGPVAFTPQTGQWFHLVLTRSGTLYSFYVNGALAGTVTDSTSIPDVSADLTIGQAEGRGYFDGLIDEVTIFNKALSADEIATIYNAGNSGMIPIDMTPDAFTFTAQTGMPINTTIVSNTISVTGINYPAAISISGGSYQINGVSWTSSSGTVNNGDTVTVRQTSSASYSTLTTATLTIGGVNGAFNVTTAASGDPNASGLVSWWKAENNALDSVGGNHGTPLNGATYAAGRVGQAFSLDGSNDMVTVPSFNMGADWTIEGWFNPASCSDGLHCPLFIRSSANQEGLVLVYLSSAYTGRANKFAFNIGNGSIWQVAMDSSLAHPYNTWHHVAVTKESNTYTMYVNGQQEAQNTTSGASTVYQSHDLQLGHWSYSVGESYTNGKFDEVKVFNRALSAGEVAALYDIVPDPFSFTAQTGMPLSRTIVSNPVTVTGIVATAISITGGEYAISTDGGSTWGSWTGLAGTVNLNDQVRVRQTSSASYSTLTAATLTIGAVSGAFNVTTLAPGDPEANGLVAWWKAENNAYDSVGANNGVWNGTVSYSAGVAGEAFSFDGSGKSVTVPASSTWAFGTGDFAVSFWAYSSTNDDHRPLINNRKTSASDNMWAIEIYPMANRVEFHSGLTVFLTATNLLTSSSWNHIAVTRSGSTLSMYINGVPSGNTSNASNFSEINDLQIGRDVMSGNDLGGKSFQGLIDEVKIFNRSLSAAEISQQAGTLPDTFAFTPVTGAARSTLVESGSITVSGISQPTAISITGGEYQLNGGAWTSSSGRVNPGATVKVRLTTSASFATPTTTTLTIGGVNGSFSVTTLADTLKPVVNEFTLTETESINMTVGVVSFIATDNDIVSGYIITTSSTPPSADDADWSGSAPATVTLALAGTNTLYAWAKDPAGNVSDPRTATLLFKPIRRGTSSYSYYEALSTACADADSGETISALAVTVPGSVTLSGGKALVLEGGFADGYGSQNGFTTLQGTLTVGSGSLAVERVVVK